MALSTNSYFLLAGVFAIAAADPATQFFGTSEGPAISLLDAGATDQATAKTDLFEELNQIQMSEQDSIQVGLMAELAGKVHFRDKKLSDLASELQPMFDALPKNAWGNLDHAVVRYALHRLLVQRHGWYIQGLEPDGMARNDSSSDKLKKWVPDFLQEVLERRMGGTGYTLPDVVALAATFQHLVRDEAAARLAGIYKIMNFDKDEALSTDKDINNMLDLFLTVYLRGGNLSATGPDHALLQLSIFKHKYADWKNVKEWADGLVENTTDFEVPTTFSHFAKVGEVIGEKFAAFNDVECRDLKRTLMDIEDQRPGRVNISQFYKVGLHSHWKFTEKVDYLKALGALDDSDPSKPAVILSNYLMSRPNCLESSHFYAICCRNECDDLLAPLENAIQAPLASPQQIIDIVSQLASDTVIAPRQLSSTLVSRLHQVADNHGGKVPLHGRLFAQWMHHAFPRECPFPHEAGTISPQTADEWMQGNGQESAQASEEEMVCYVSGECAPASLPNERAGESTELPWIHTEELLIETAPKVPEVPEVTNSQRPSQSPSSQSTASMLHRLNQVLRKMAIMSIVAGLFVASKILYQKPGEDPDAKLRKIAKDKLGNSLNFIVLPLFVVLSDFMSGDFSSNDLLLVLLSLVLAGMVVAKRGGLDLGFSSEESSCSGALV